MNSRQAFSPPKSGKHHYIFEVYEQKIFNFDPIENRDWNERIKK